MLDQLSQGRLIVLLLRGTPSEFKAYEPVDPALTQPKTQAATRLVRKALTDTAPFAWKDEFFDYPNIAIWPRPLQQPLPPMYFSGNSLNSAEFAAQSGSACAFHFIVRKPWPTLSRTTAPKPDAAVGSRKTLHVRSDRLPRFRLGCRHRYAGGRARTHFPAASPALSARWASAGPVSQRLQKDRRRNRAVSLRMRRHSGWAACFSRAARTPSSSVSGVPVAHRCRRGGPCVQFSTNRCRGRTTLNRVIWSGGFAAYPFLWCSVKHIPKS